MEPPPPSAYQMEYKKTSTDPTSVVYLGVLAEVREGTLHTTIYDREDEYPFHITRYPEYDTVAPHQQFGGVLMGRLVACQEACSHMQDFKESVANVVRRALWRSYPVKLISSVWSRFLHRRWTVADIRKKELLQWFRRMLDYVINQNRREPLDYRKPYPPLRSQR